MDELCGRILRTFAFLLLLLSVGPATGHATDDERAGRSAETGRSWQAGVQAVIEDATALATAPLRMDRQEALAAGAALAIVGGMFAADRSIRTLVLRNPSSSGRDVAEGFNSFGSPAGLAGLNAGVIAIGAIGASSGGASRMTDAGLVALESEGFAVAATMVFKQMIGRSRPGSAQGTSSFRPLIGRGGSFPSTHAAASFAVATVFAERFEAPVGWLAYALATAVAASRVYVDEHFASDVVAGSLLGWGLGTFLSKRHPTLGG